MRALELVWIPELEKSVSELKRVIASDRIVRIADPQQRFILQTDASSVAIGAVLLQYFADANRELPVAFYSRALSQSELRYSTYEKEMLAVVKATEHFRIYLIGRPYTVRTDHSPIRELAKSKLEIMRVERWAMRLSEYDFEVEVVKGCDNVVADALSRIRWLEGREPSEELGIEEEEFCVEYSDSEDVFGPPEEFATVELVRETPEEPPGPMAPTIQTLRVAQESDPEFSQVLTLVRACEVPPPEIMEGKSEFLRACVQSFAQLHIVGDVLVLHDEDGSPNQRVLVPPLLITPIIEYFHKGPFSAHDSFQRTFVKIAQQFFW